MKYFVILFQCMRVTFNWVGLGSLTKRSIMMGSRIGILLQKTIKPLLLDR